MDKERCINEMESQMEKVLSHLDSQLLKLRAGKATPGMLSGVMVSYYGSQTPLDQVAGVNTTDARTIVIQPWEKRLLPEIEKAIHAANLGLNPQNNGEMIRILVPPLTEERRRELVKQARGEGESAKVAIRNARREANDQVKKLQKEGLPEDEGKAAEVSIQKISDRFGERIDAAVASKEKEIMTV